MAVSIAVLRSSPELRATAQMRRQETGGGRGRVGERMKGRGEDGRARGRGREGEGKGNRRGGKM